jgi:uncharacterized membrane protein
MIDNTRDLTPPATITAAFFGYLLSTVAAVVGVFVVLSSKQTLLSDLRTAQTQQGHPLTETQLEHAANVAVSIGVVVLVVIALIYLLLAFRLRAGRNWARVLLTISSVFQLASLIAVHGSAVNYVSTGVAVIAAVLCYLPASNAYIRSVKRAS